MLLERLHKVVWWRLKLLLQFQKRVYTNTPTTLKCTFSPIIYILNWFEIYFQWDIQCNKRIHLKSTHHSPLVKCESSWRKGRLFRSCHCNGTVIATPTWTMKISLHRVIIHNYLLALFWHHNVPSSLVILKNLENAATSSDCFQIQIWANEITYWPDLHEYKKEKFWRKGLWLSLDYMILGQCFFHTYAGHYKVNKAQPFLTHSGCSVKTSCIQSSDLSTCW